jgi:hypothetical protein
MYRFFSIILVSIYLLAVGTYLILSRRIYTPGMMKVIRLIWRKKYKSDSDLKFHKEEGYCWLVQVPGYICSDAEGVSTLKIFEDDKELGPAHFDHNEIRKKGLGKFCHWGDHIYFSTSDNSDPNTNGKKYRIEE